MILCQICSFETGETIIAKIDDLCPAYEVIKNIANLFCVDQDGRMGNLFSCKRKGVINYELSLFQQGVRNADRLIYIKGGE